GVRSGVLALARALRRHTDRGLIRVRRTCPATRRARAATLRVGIVAEATSERGQAPIEEPLLVIDPGLLRARARSAFTAENRREAVALANLRRVATAVDGGAGDPLLLLALDRQRPRVVAEPALAGLLVPRIGHTRRQLVEVHGLRQRAGLALP